MVIGVLSFSFSSCSTGLQQRLQHIDLTSPFGHSRVSFPFSWCSTGGPGAQLSAGFHYCILSPTGLFPRAPSTGWWLFLTHIFSNSSDLQFNQGPQGSPPPGSGFLYHILTPTFSGPQLTGFLFTPSYIIVQSPTQSPTQSLEWHVWSSSSGNNCHAVHRSLSSGASVYECIMGFYLVLFRQPNRLRDIFRLLAIGMCHFLLVHRFGMACLAGSKVNIQQFVRYQFLIMSSQLRP